MKMHMVIREQEETDKQEKRGNSSGAQSESIDGTLSWLQRTGTYVFIYILLLHTCNYVRNACSTLKSSHIRIFSKQKLYTYIPYLKNRVQKYIYAISYSIFIAWRERKRFHEWLKTRKHCIYIWSTVLLLLPQHKRTCNWELFEDYFIEDFISCYYFSLRKVWKSDKKSRLFNKQRVNINFHLLWRWFNML